MELIKTIEDRCHECYACIRNCPAKAVRVYGGQAEVMEERCINCANCVNICSQGAKEILTQQDSVESLLDSGNRVVAGLAPSFPGHSPGLAFDEWREFLLQLGFAGVYEVALGAGLMIEEYRRYLEENEGPVISTPCPVVVNYVCKYYPSLVGNLAPITSPMGALVRYLREVEGIESIVLIGPCHAKKAEMEPEPGVEAVLTYSELEELAASRGLQLNQFQKTGEGQKGEGNHGLSGEDIEIDRAGNSGSDSDIKVKVSETEKSEAVELPKESRKIPLAGGLQEALCCEVEPGGCIKVEGPGRIAELLESLATGEMTPHFVDALFCEGCIAGVDLSEKSFFRKEKAVREYIGAKEGKLQAEVNRLNLEKRFTPDPQSLEEPGEEEIWMVLNRTGKEREEDLLNCGACGYNSCREKAAAVVQGLAEEEMCLPYLLSEKRSEIKEVQKLNSELDSIINSSYDGILVVDGNGCVERVNDAYLEMTGMREKDLLGQKVSELEAERVIFPSVSLLSLRERRDITLVQNTVGGGRILVTATPIFAGEDRIERVIVNARDLEELNLDTCEEEEKSSAGHDEIELPVVGRVVSQSRQMQSVLSLCEKISGTDSTVLVSGESGVGKEVVARYIHELSEEREEFVKINCAAIPERLLESELFGYETGAFSGARREGKKGLIEKADHGTLFLDEIGEMPLNMQAKLLQVIQEHRLTRIGGINSIGVNFRLITATNQNLLEMVEQGEFREDLFYRLNVVPIEIPPLRERPDDIIPLVEYYAGELAEKYGQRVEFTDQARQFLLSYEWPGNVRELTNLLERAALTSEEGAIGRDFLEHFLEASARTRAGINVNKVLPLQEAVAEVEKKLLRKVRNECSTTYEMAEVLGVNQSTVVRKLKKYFG
ncbi:MAG: sigma 54-interacting transcriptional regulator [Bacillota bacterium]